MCKQNNSQEKTKKLVAIPIQYNTTQDNTMFVAERAKHMLSTDWTMCLQTKVITKVVYQKWMYTNESTHQDLPKWE